MSAFHCKSASISCLPKKRDKVKVFYQSSLFIWFFGFALFALSGCYSEKKGEAEHNNVSFYDDNLDVLETRSIMRGTTINPSNIRSGSWYKAGENASTTSHQLRGDVNFYASPSVFEINDESGLKEVNATCGTTSKHILLNDIALTSEWKPLCSAATDKRFVGILNGNARKITGLQIDSDENYIGLFKYIGAYGVVKNLGVIIANDKEINGSQYVGAIAGYIDGGLVENSYAEGNVSGAYGYIGGIAGYVNVGSIKRSYSEGNVSGSGSGIGGLVGRLEGSSIADSYSKGYIAGYGDNNQMVGGIAGQAYGGGGSIKRSYSEGNVSGAQRIGGIAGYIDGATIENVYSVGDVDGNNSVGGIAGYVNVGSIRYSYSEGNVSGDGNVSGIVGYIYSGAISNNAAINEKITGNADVNRTVGNGNSGTVENNFALETMIVVGSGANGNAGTNKPQAQLKTREAYENATNNNGLGWKFGNDDESPWVWGAFSGYPYPTLYWQTKSLSRY